MVERTARSLVRLMEQVAAARSKGPGGTSPTVVESTRAAGLMPPLHAHEEDEALQFFEGSAAPSSVEVLGPPGTLPAQRVSE